MSENGDLPDSKFSAWQRLVGEAEELAEEYGEEGWETAVVHPGQVVAVDATEYFGLSALAPDSEYDRVRSLVDANEFDQSHVYRHTDDSITFFLCVFEANVDQVAVVVPTYTSEVDLDMLYPRAREADEMQIHVHPLEYEERATLTVADPDLFFEAEE